MSEGKSKPTESEEKAPSELEKAFSPSDLIDPELLPQQDELATELLRALQSQLIEMELLPTEERNEKTGRKMLVHPKQAGVDLTEWNQDELVEAEMSRLAKLTYATSYLRLLESIARPPTSVSHQMDQGKLSLAYIRHAETNDKERLRLESTAGGAALEQALSNVEEQILVLASRRLKRTSNGESSS